MAQPQWITPAGSLGVIPEGVFYSVNIQAVAEGEDVKFRLIAGELPDGVQVTANGIIEGVPKNVARVQGVPQEVSVDTTSRFAIRAFTTRTVNGRIVVDRLADRTFTLTITGQDTPEFITPPGSIGTFFDGSLQTLPIQFSDRDPGDRATISIISGSLPKNLILDKRTGIISGIIEPLAKSQNFTFTMEIDDGKNQNVRTFSMYVYARKTMTADNSVDTADNTFLTADLSPIQAPLLLTPAGSLGRTRADNFYAFKFEAIDFNGDPFSFSLTTGAGIGYDSGLVIGSPGTYDVDGYDRGGLSLPPGLSLDPVTGWFYGYIPNQGTTEQTYQFGVQVYKDTDPDLISPLTYFSLTIAGDVETEIIWLNDSDLGTILNGSISTLAVRAVNTGGRELSYRLVGGSDSKLPQGLTLQENGDITGRVSFNTFALDNGSTTFDTNLNTRLGIDETTFDMQFDFTVNAYSATSEQIIYKVGSIIVTNGGSGYTSQPTVTISAPPTTDGAIAATAGVATIVDGVITGIALGNPGLAFDIAPTITITGGGGSGATAVTRLVEANLVNAVSVFRRFSITVKRYFNEPYERLYIKCMPPQKDRNIIDQLIFNRDIFPPELIYRGGDPNFGVASYVVYDHAYGVNAATIETYIESLDINHYWKNITLGQLRTAQALDDQGNILYEVVYSQIVDDLVNNQGQSVGKQITLPYPVELADSTTVDTVYPNSLINMRDQVISVVGQIAPPLTPALPLWMTSKQTDGRVLGFTPAWVICYTLPGASGRILYNIQQQFGDQLNKIDFKIDRYELDRSQTHNWLPYADSSIGGKWIPYPPAATVYDEDHTYFDERSVRFISPADRWTGTDQFDKYLVFPRTNILD